MWYLFRYPVDDPLPDRVGLFFGQISQVIISYFVDGSVITAVEDDSTSVDCGVFDGTTKGAVD